MLLRLHKFALRLSPLRSFCLVLVCAGIALFLYAVLQPGSSPSPLLGMGLLLTLWALLLFAFIHLFQSIPSPVLPRDAFFERLRSRVKLALYHLLALGVLVLGLALVFISLKLLSIAAG